MKGLVSIIIPVYKVERYIQRCLMSVLHQTYDKIEIVLVDDCGEDNSIELAKEFLSKNNCQHYRIIRHDKNRGLSASRNTGVKNAIGEYIYFLDGDDEVTTECIQNLVEAYTGVDGVDMVMAGIVRRLPDRDIDYVKYQPTVVSSRKALMEQFIKRRIAWNAVSRLFKRSLWVKNGIFFYEGITSEDMLWNFLLLPYLRKVVLINDCSYIYYQTSNSIMTSARRNIEFAKDYIRIANIARNEVLRFQERNYVRYYHYLRYNFMPNALLWHGYSYDSFCLLAKELLEYKTCDCQQYMSLRLRLLLSLPESFITKSWIWKFKLKGIFDIVKYKLGYSLH